MDLGTAATVVSIVNGTLASVIGLFKLWTLEEGGSAQGA